jgi:hypothetical protein
MAVRTRFRFNVTPNTIHLGHVWVEGTGTDIHYYASKPYQQTTYDELHKRSTIGRGKNKRKLFLHGGPLTAYLTECTFSPTKDLALQWSFTHYDGKLICNRFGSNPNVNFWASDGTSMTAMGTKGIAKFKPGNPAAGLGQFLVELRQLPNLPKFVVSAFKSPRKATTLSGLRENLFNFKQLGSEYLNVEFGWKPFLNDLRKLFDFQQGLAKQLEQLRRDNGKVVRRRGTITKAESSSVSQDTGTIGLYPALATQFYDSSSGLVHRRSLTTTTFSRYWFSGAFRYWIPDIGSDQWTSRAKRALLGVNPSPSLLWEVLPWSWLVDWFSSVGDSINNMSSNAAENLVILYGYSMGTSSTVEHAEASSRLVNAGWVSSSQTRTSYVKRRVKASPFGFGISLPDLSVRQLAILSALGLSKRPYQ